MKKVTELASSRIGLVVMVCATLIGLSKNAYSTCVTSCPTNSTYVFLEAPSSTLTFSQMFAIDPTTNVIKDVLHWHTIPKNSSSAPKLTPDSSNANDDTGNNIYDVGELNDGSQTQDSNFCPGGVCSALVGAYPMRVDTRGERCARFDVAGYTLSTLTKNPGDKYKQLYAAQCNTNYPQRMKDTNSVEHYGYKVCAIACN